MNNCADICANVQQPVINAFTLPAGPKENTFFTGQYNTSSPDCNSSTLVIPCDFEPIGAAVIYTSSIYGENVLLSSLFIKHPTQMKFVYGFCLASRTSSTSDYEVKRYASDANVDNLFYYSNGKVYLKAPISGSLWGTGNYRVVLFQ